MGDNREDGSVALTSDQHSEATVLVAKYHTEGEDHLSSSTVQHISFTELGLEKVLDLWVQLMKNGGKNKSVAFIILFSIMCVRARVSKQRINIKIVQMKIYSGLFPLTKFM